MVSRNIPLSYLLAFAKNSWFWLGIWVFYYLLFTDYAGIGLIETVLIVTLTLTEVPTGAIADLLGRKNTLTLSFILNGFGGILMGLAPDSLTLILSVFVSAIGVTMYSGTLEALVFDSLKQDNRENNYPRCLSNINAVHLLSPAVCGAIGGFMYVASPRLPFLSAGAVCLIGAVVCLFLTEPQIGSEKFTLGNFVAQTRQGFKQLFHSPGFKRQTLLLVSIGFVVVIADEMLNSFLGVEFGFSPVAIGLFWSLIYLVSAIGSKLTPWLSFRLGEIPAVVLTGGIIAVSLAVSPLLGLVLGGASLLLRSLFQAVYTNLASSTINRHTESRYRATTLSSFNMLKNVPYVLTAFLVGSLADVFSAKTIALWLGLFLAVLLFFQLDLVNNSKMHSHST